MRVEFVVVADRQELQRLANLFCETFHSSCFNTGKSKRIRAQMFNNKEWEVALKIFRMCSRWCLHLGVPDEKKFEDFEYMIWKKLENYCMSI